MFLFLLTAVPIAYLFLLAFMRQTDQPVQLTLVPFVKGMLAFVPAFALLLVLEHMVPNRFNAGPLYLRFTLVKIGVPLLAAVIGALLITGRRARVDFPGAMTATLSFISGYYSVSGILDTIRNIGQTDPYTLFLLPATRLVILVLLPVLLVAAHREVGVLRAAMLLGIVAIPAALGVVPLLYRTGFRGWAMIAAGALLAAAVVVYFKLAIDRMPIDTEA